MFEVFSSKYQIILINFTSLQLNMFTNDLYYFICSFKSVLNVYEVIQQCKVLSLGQGCSDFFLSALIECWIFRGKKTSKHASYYKIHVFQKIQPLRRTNTFLLRKIFLWNFHSKIYCRYFGSTDGTFRLYPGTRLNAFYDPRKRPW